MNTLAMNRQMGRESVLKRLATQPIDAWSRRRTALTAIAFGTLVCVLGGQMWRASGISGVDASRSTLDEMQRRVQRTGSIVSALPALRARLAHDRQATARWTSADALQSIPTLAAQHGLRVSAIEPVSGKSGASDGERALKLRAEGTFGEVRRFLDALGSLPRLVVADAVQLKRGPNSPAFEATLRVFETLPVVARLVQTDRRDVSVIDPFGKKGAAAFGTAGEMLLVGTLIGRKRAMALVETASGIDGFAPGQMIGDERLGRVKPRSIDLARGDGQSRTVAFAEDRP
ncbi:hypothetical protein AWB67_03876 [Caballeronia terrestris]|uniref:Pilus assembly protein, PilO n=1 Tax=Caballeronia terrestris TaxID=1226301 RepID=A0A158JKI4_9BURK|nr:type 4a pilus biogenesis protein PilO [Caballeronia terrestris]SAL68860.1 hypothetical protein AWB67_03876 [Caballeronia terrestris]